MDLLLPPIDVHPSIHPCHQPLQRNAPPQIGRLSSTELPCGMCAKHVLRCDTYHQLHVVARYPKNALLRKPCININTTMTRRTTHATHDAQHSSLEGGLGTVAGDVSDCLLDDLGDAQGQPALAHQQLVERHPEYFLALRKTHTHLRG